MQPGSLRVNAGDRVKAGDPIGLIGNSGKTIGPHLHFHLIDRASSLAGDGLPFVFAAFIGQGVLGDDALTLAFQGQPAPVDVAKLAGRHVNQHPLNNQVVDFGD
jgi:murein DD-endopeptidase MepM/ murein hydrolase activator NlpD